MLLALHLYARPSSAISTSSLILDRRHHMYLVLVAVIPVLGSHASAKSTATILPRWSEF